MRFLPHPLLGLLTLGLAACGAPATTGRQPSGPHDTAGADELAQATPLVPGVHRGTLTSESPMLAQGQRVALYRLTLGTTRRVQLRMRSAQVDPLLELTGPGGFRAANDDAFPGTLDAILELVPEVAGTYVLRASTAVAGQLGAFELELREEDPVGRGDALTLGAAQDGSLGAPNVPGMPGRWLHFQADAGTIFHLRVTSTAFDTVATVIAPDGQRWTNDDANDLGPDGTERGLDSTVTFAAPRDGVYQLVVTAYGGQGMGPFRVRSRLRPPPRLGADGSRPDGLAGPEGGGRVLGLFAGITQYGARGDLYGCADDARFLAEAFMGSHLQQKSDHVLLTDAQVTRDAFLGGVRTLVSQARPEDVVVIFYSGHGGQVARTPASLGELDAFDETLILSDAALRDDELAEALTGLRAGTLIVALDSCNSGGFARDLIDRPGRMGLFSSDEDVLSDTAEPRRAGGYLSWYLRRGVLGEADARPSDGVLMAGELSDYLYDGFVRDHALINAEGSTDPAQRLIVERGSLAWGHVLWAYPRSASGQRIPMPDLALTSLPPR